MIGVCKCSFFFFLCGGGKGENKESKGDE
jgi:hypothetical protein